MTSETINPYQPPPTAGAIPFDVGDGEVCFYTTDANLRFAESHFVLRLHPLRLIIVSLVLIAVSSMVMIISVMQGTEVFAVSSVVAMIVSALVYLASVYQTKLRLRRRWEEHGLLDGSISSVSIDQNQLVLQSPAGVFRWPIATIKTYRTRKGLMISPEPLLCLFVPKKNQSPPESFDELQAGLGK